MKRCVFFILLTTIILGSCQKDGPVGPPDLLYKRWHLTQTRTLDSNVWQSTDTDAYYTVEYQSDGTLVYQRNSVMTQANCCAPTTFNRQRETINYREWKFCSNAYCATTKLVTINQLTETVLELNDGYRISQYEAAR